MVLKRVLGFWDCVFINLASIIGAGIFVIIGVASGLAGPAVAISMIVAGVASIFIGLIFAELGEFIPKEGGFLSSEKSCYRLSQVFWVVGCGFSPGLWEPVPCPSHLQVISFP